MHKHIAIFAGQCESDMSFKIKMILSADFKALGQTMLRIFNGLGGVAAAYFTAW